MRLSPKSILHFHFQDKWRSPIPRTGEEATPSGLLWERPVGQARIRADKVAAAVMEAIAALLRRGDEEATSLGSEEK